MFDGSGCYLTFLLSNGIQLGNTDAGPVPMNYPGFQNTDCSPTRTFGSWSDIVDISMQIDCPVAVEEESWSGMKQLFR